MFRSFQNISIVMPASNKVKKATPKDVDDYLRSVPAQALPALKALRSAIRAAAPSAEETIAYGVPTYRQQGPLVSFAATPKHCAFYVMSQKPLASRKTTLREYDLAPTAIRFPAEAGLPKALVIAIVKERIQENEARVSSTK
jgi:uncharacterized protein YdhG (YjbR/CyaY superfamily)